MIFVLFVLFMGRTEISFSPFYIRMPGWQNVVGWLLLLIGKKMLYPMLKDYRVKDIKSIGTYN